MSSDPGDPGDEFRRATSPPQSAVGRTERSAGSDSHSRAKARAQTGPCRLRDVAWLAGWQRVRLGGNHRLGDWLGSRPRASHQSCVSDCIFLDRRCRGDLERDPADFAKTVSLKRNSPLSRANSPDKDVRRSASQAERDASLGGAEPLAGRFKASQRGGRRRGLEAWRQSRDRRSIRSTNLPCIPSFRFWSGAMTFP